MVLNISAQNVAYCEQSSLSLEAALPPGEKQYFSLRLYQMNSERKLLHYLLIWHSLLQS